MLGIVRGYGERSDDEMTLLGPGFERLVCKAKYLGGMEGDVEMVVVGA